MRLEEFAAKLRSSRNIVFFTGAGISTESGVPDFRSPGGIWTKYQPVYFQDFLSSEAARIQHWKLKKATYELYKKVKPNTGHYAIRDFEQRGQLLGLITQNIDGLHGIAGVSGEKLIEIHGTDRLVTCLSCHRSFEPSPFMKLSAKTFRRPLAIAAAVFSKAQTSPSAKRCQPTK
jgi:NAD-dependent deacetylase